VYRRKVPDVWGFRVPQQAVDLRLREGIARMQSGDEVED
jgi:hypothetical protein